MEVITPETEKTVADAIRTGNKAALNAYARFLRPIAQQILAKNPSPGDKSLLEDYAGKVTNATIDKFNAPSSRCK
jgi:hypothetical protein